MADAHGVALGDPPHQPDRRTAVEQVDAPARREAVALVERQVARLRVLEVDGDRVAVAAVEDLADQPRAASAALPRGIDADREQVEVRRRGRVQALDELADQRRVLATARTHDLVEDLVDRLARRLLDPGRAPHRGARAVREQIRLVAVEVRVARDLAEQCLDRPGAALVLAHDPAGQRVVVERGAQHLPDRRQVGGRRLRTSGDVTRRRVRRPPRGTEAGGAAAGSAARGRDRTAARAASR